MKILDYKDRQSRISASTILGIIMDQETTTDTLSTPKERGLRLKRLRNLANLSRRDIEDKYYIKINTLKGWEVGRHGGLTEKGAIKILNILEQEGVICTLDWILYDIGRGPTVAEKFDTEPEEEITVPTHIKESEEKQIIDELIFFRQNHANTIDLIIDDDSMEPCYKKGMYVAGIKRFEDKIGKVVGHNCIVQTTNGRLLLRNLRKGSKPGSYNLICLNTQSNINEPVIYNTELVSAAPVIWQRIKDPE